MKIKCKKENIKKGFQIIESVVSGSTINPILQNVKIIAKDNTLELSATDLEISVNHVIESVEVMEPGEIVGPELKIASIVKEWNDEHMEITGDDLKCVMKGKDNYFKILCSDKKEFPVIPQFVNEDYVKVDKTVLIDMMKKTAFIILGERARYGSNGVFLDIDGNQAKMVANDGRRLAEVKRKIDNPSGMAKNCIIPIKGILQMQRVMSDQDGVVKVRIEEKRILVKTKSSTVCSQLIEGQYPKYEEVIPSNLDKKAILDKQIFSSAVRRGAVMTTDEYKLLKFKFSGKTLELECISPDVGESKVVVPVEYAGGELEIGLNPEFILDFLKTVDTDEIKFELKDQSTAGVFKTAGGCIYVVMPMNLGGDEVK
ncbi:MAG: DNA polymerase III beta subunit [Candidatus Scalindua rubra]|uniref:Beta sliding clamp n=1 Tax=Candidatus Scalindua rubra TaxID=1872076 RepID=A0A1E3XBB7_9BACT|nr:MAG: DNA polymerase III beta subunit [Candidatus Scalindua rubra]